MFILGSFDALDSVKSLLDIFQPGLELTPALGPKLRNRGLEAPPPICPQAIPPHIVSGHGASQV
jgi:hypothetical protein